MKELKQLLDDFEMFMEPILSGRCDHSHLAYAYQTCVRIERLLKPGQDPKLMISPELRSRIAATRMYTAIEDACRKHLIEIQSR